MNYAARIQEITRLRCPKKVEVRKPSPTGAHITFELRPWEILTTRETETTFECALIIPTGYSTNDIRQETDSIYAACGAYVTIKDRGGVAIVSISKIDYPDMIEYSDNMLSLTSGREVLVGFDILGKPITHNFRVPHVLIGAQSGYGKTDLIRFWLYQLITRFTPEQLQIDIVDLKGYSFLPFRGIPHIRSISRDLAGAHKTMKDAKHLMQTRSDDVWNSGDRSRTAEYSWRIVLVDELYMISPSNQITKDAKEMATEVYANMAAISCVGREASVGVIMATQRPDVNVVHPQVKQNCDVSIAFKCKTATNSEIILDRAGAENLPHGKPGRGIYSGMTECIFQVPYIGKDDAWDTLLSPYRRLEAKPIEPNQTTNDIDANDL